MSDRILFIPGSFNPITNAHIEMAKIAAESSCKKAIELMIEALKSENITIENNKKRKWFK